MRLRQQVHIQSIKYMQQCHTVIQLQYSITNYSSIYNTNIIQTINSKSRSINQNPLTGRSKRPRSLQGITFKDQRTPISMATVSVDSQRKIDDCLSWLLGPCPRACAVLLSWCPFIRDQLISY